MELVFLINKKTPWKLVLLLLLAICFAAAWLFAQHVKTLHHQLSVKPPSQFSNITLESDESTLGLKIRLPYHTLAQVAEQATAKPQTGEGSKQTCKKVLGLNACATLLWQYQIERRGRITVSREQNALQLRLPLSLDGHITVDGRGGKLLGLRNKQINGQLELIADLKIDAGQNWCPELNASLRYDWLSDPSIRLAGKFKINLRKSADKALSRKLQQLEKRFTDLIDCGTLRTRVAQHWKVHYLPIKIPGQPQSFLQIIPASVAVSRATPMDDHLNAAFEIKMKSQVTYAQEQHQPLILPALSRGVATPGTVEFSLLLNLTYDQLRTMIADKLLNATMQSRRRQITVTSFDLYPSNERLIFDLGFKVSGFGKFFESSGNLYLSAKPVADPDSNELRFDDLQFTRIIDSDLWSVFSTVLHSHILDTLKKSAVINLGSQVHKLEQSISNTLSDPAKTAGLIVQASSPQVRLVAVNPQANSLAAIIHVSTRLEAEVPASVLIKK